MSVLDAIREIDSGKPKETPAPVVPPIPEDQQAQSDVGIPDDLISSLTPKSIVETPPEAKPDADLEKALSSDEPPKEKVAWAKTKHEIKVEREARQAAEARIKELEAEVLSAKEKDAKIAELDKVVGQISLEKSEAFKRAHDYQIQSELGRVAQILQTHGGRTKEDAERIAVNAIRKPFADRNRFLNDEAPELSGVLNNILMNVDDKVQKREAALQNWKAEQAALQESEKRSEQVRTIKTLEQHLAKALEDSVTAGNIFLIKSESDTPRSKAWNQQVELDQQAIKQILIKNDSAEIARLVTEGYTTRKLREEYRRVLDENKALKAQNKGISAIKPSVTNREVSVETKEELPKGIGVEGLAAHIYQQALKG